MFTVVNIVLVKSVACYCPGSFSSVSARYSMLLMFDWKVFRNV